MSVWAGIIFHQLHGRRSQLGLHRRLVHRRSQAHRSRLDLRRARMARGNSRARGILLLPGSLLLGVRQFMTRKVLAVGRGRMRYG
ncbi:MAG: hypothetical protein ICV60_09790 [Pyrinomonadaceae bacterium]|nr:hypothetical protein [Pyrinomonadaceae bacterium]